MQETIRMDKYKDAKYYKQNVTTDETTRPETIIIPNTPLKLNFRELSKDYNRHIILNYYYEYLMKRQRFNFNNLDKNDRRYEYLNKFNELSDKIIQSNQSYFITGPGGSGKTTLLKQIQSTLTKQDKKHITLCPTNLAALLVGGMTIHKFSTKIKVTFTN